jgi:metal-responsive CopG/Arc/MetJ family transcriptional regulator
MGPSATVVVDLSDELLQRLDRLVLCSASGLATLSRQDLIVDAVERYVTGAEIAAPGLTEIPLDPSD